ncbi:MAG: Z1 domain-containing protein, partial [Acidimicrobiia bacterium]
MKHAHHLRAAAEMLRQNVYPHLDEVGHAHLLVLDDEADDGSILDARVEHNLDPALDYLKQLPRQIVDLWSTRISAPGTVHSNLKATYIGYTATPQANFLQSDQNPLAPKDFVCALRTPSDVGELLPRASTYREPVGLSAFYTGGDAFYRRLTGAAALTVPQTSSCLQDVATPAPYQRGVWIADAVRSYLVAGAVRLYRGAPRPATVNDVDFASRHEAVAASPPPHTMLLHPSSSVDDHFVAAAELLAWGHAVPIDEGRRLLAAGVRHLDIDAISADMDREPSRWTHWLSSFGASAAELRSAYSLEVSRETPAPGAWPEVRAILVEELLPHVKLAIINSNPDADDKPEFGPRLASNGRWTAAGDLLTIFVSGNIMARGLTLEGLTTTLFLRMSDAPVADTQMQMQRWFGYRGSYLELCRVFAPAQQLALFQQYHGTDEALRRQIVHEMNEAGESAPTPLVLEGAGFAATAKIAGVAKVPLCPGASLFVDHVNDGGE